MFKKILVLTSIFILGTSCGFKIVDYSETSNFIITKIETSGNNKVNYNLKKKLQRLSNSNGTKNITLIFSSEINKNIKEKNIKNEITKYKLELVTNVTYKILSDLTENTLTIKVSGDYLVTKKYSQTLINEKELIKNLTNELAKKITRKLMQNLNDT